MNYPKAVMRKTELEKMGFPEEWLMRVFRKHGQKVAWKMGNGRNAPILFDTDALEKIRTASCGLGRGVQTLTTIRSVGDMIETI